MFFYDGYCCPVCKQPLEEGEDIVTCPQCGAPHHRTCWQQTGHCFFAADHGTDAQWSREAAERAQAEAAKPVNRCARCGSNNAPDARFCEHCGRPLTDEYEPQRPQQDEPQQDFRRAYQQQYGPFGARMPDPTGGIPANEEIEGIAAADFAAYAGQNPQYYVPRFKRIAEGRRVSWNWPAFLVPQYWLFFRKQYGWGALYVAFQLFYQVFASAIFQPYLSTEGALDLKALIEGLAGTPQFYVLYAVAMISLGLNVLFGLFGNSLYMYSAVKKIKAYREDHPLYYPQELREIGGISLVLPLVSYLATNVILQIINHFLF